MSNNIKGHYEAVKSELQQNPAIVGVTATSMPLKGVTSTYSISVDELGIQDEMIIVLSTDEDFIPTMDIELVAGSNYSGTPVDAAGVILNETAVKRLNITDPIGKACSVRGSNRTVLGVVKDFHFKDLHTPVEPLAIIADSWLSSLYVKASTNSTSQAITAVEKLWKQYESELPFSYYFIDDEFDTIYKSDIRTSILFRYFAMIAIFVSCLGLFSLVTYTAETKTKEIGIRKVLGASVASIVKMLSREFLILVGIAMLIAFPLAYFWLDRILQDYAYRIPVDWWIFVLTGMITIALTLITIGRQAIKAASANPVKAIKSE
jgi:ABC-type antimicrobial peptide transport system permease subunit